MKDYVDSTLGIDEDGTILASMLGEHFVLTVE